MIVMEAQDRASVPLDELIAKIKDLTRSMDDAALKIGAAGDKIDASLAKTATEATADADVLKRAIDKNTNSTNALTDALKKTVSAMDPVSSKSKIMALGLTSLMGPLSGILALGPVAIFGAMALGAAKLTSSLQQAALQAKHTKQPLSALDQQLIPFSKHLNQIFAPVNAAAKGAFTNLLAVFNKLTPVLVQASTALAPMITVLGSGLGALLQNLLEPLSNMLTNLMPLVKVLATGLGTLGTGLAGLFQNLNLSAAVGGLNAVFKVVGMLLPVLGQLIGALAPIGNIILSVLVPAIGGALMQVLTALAPVFVQMGPVISAFAGVFAELITTFGDLLTAVVPLIPAILQMFTAFDNLDTTFEALDPLFAALSKALVPLIGIIVKIASIVVGVLNTALTQLAVAITPLVPVLGQLADTILTALLDVFQALEPAITPIVQVIISLLPFVGQLAQLLAQLIKIAVVPLIGFFGKLLTALLPILPPLTTLATSILQTLMTVLKSLMPAIQTLMGGFTQLLPSIVALVPSLVQIIQAVTQLIPPLTPLLLLITKLAVQLAGPMTSALVMADKFLYALLRVILDVAVPAFDGLLKTVVFVIKSLTQLLQGIINFVEGVFTGNWSKAWSGVRDIFSGFVKALGSPIVLLFKEVGEIPTRIKDLFKDTASWLFNAGANIISGLWKGMSSAVGALLSNVENVGKSVVSSITSFFHINSPSLLMADEVGSPIVEGIAHGMLTNVSMINGAIAKLGAVTVNTAKGSLVTGLGGGTATIAAASNSQSGSGSVYVDLRGSQMMTERDMDLLVGKLGRALATRILPSGGLRVVPAR